MAMLGLDNYLCEACKNYDTDGADGNHPSCSKQYGYSRAVRLGEKCPYGYEPGVPSGYPVSMKMNKRRAEEVMHALEVMKKDSHDTEWHPQPKEQWTTALLSGLAWPDDGSWPDYLSVARNRESAEGGEWRVYVPEDATVGAGMCEVEIIDTGYEAIYEHYEYIMHCNEYIMHCKHCNHEYGYVQYDKSGGTWMDEPPNFCPYCGAKVVSERWR